MATEESCVPGAHLMESMRAVGYSLETAIADIIDNSISASATNIQIDFSMDVDPQYLSILDDGCGMSPEVARNAMRLAGISASSIRAENDLGRFGLGLKTASLSQCRHMTVITKADGLLTGLVWDLDHMITRNEWSLIVLDRWEMNDVWHFDRLNSQDHGTLVVWTNFDRISAPVERISAEFDSQMITARDHLALIFHQFLNGDYSYPKVQILINSELIKGFDPFLSHSIGTQISPLETIVVEGVAIDLQPYTLPYLSKMSENQRRLAQAPGPLRDSQGFYIYRGGRLVIWGTWFRLLPKSEGGKLARVKVDVPNSLDHLWSLDIKKSTAVPPLEVRDHLKRFAVDLAAPSEKAIGFRGRKQKSNDDVARVWDVIIDRDTFRYRINRDHPLLQRVQESLAPSDIQSLESALEIIELYFPSQDLVSRFSKDQISSNESEEVVIKDQLLSLWAAGNDGLGSPTEFVDWIIGFEPWNQFRTSPEVLVNWVSESDSLKGEVSNG